MKISIRKGKANGKDTWILDIHSNGNRNRKFFKTYADAKKVRCGAMDKRRNPRPPHRDITRPPNMPLRNISQTMKEGIPEQIPNKKGIP